MYSTCLFCNTDLGKNEEIEQFPIGRRLAFDEAKGRLWVVCRRCERWNLTPLEERWEAIEQCEKAFRGTKLRVSTDHIGLARLKEGLELVRIGEPQRPEMAAWRYGDQFGRRRRLQSLTWGGIAVAAVGVVVVGPLVGLAGAGLFPALQVLGAGFDVMNARRVITLDPTNAESLRMRFGDVAKVQLQMLDDGILLRVPVLGSPTPWWKRPVGAREERELRGEAATPWWNRPVGAREERELTGEAAMRAAAALLPSLNTAGGSKDEVSRAVGYLEEAGDAQRLFRRAAESIAKRDANRLFSIGSANLLKNLPTAGRLALEMASHEESERRALEGELSVLEESWRQAEEIAAIADDMFLPASVDEDLARLKGKRDADS